MPTRLKCCLHVRPVLNLRLEKDACRSQVRAIAEEAFALVRSYKGSNSGEHGDGLVRSEFHEAMFGSRLVRAFEEIKDTFDPDGILNPGKIVRAPRFDDRSLLHTHPTTLSKIFSRNSTGHPIPAASGASRALSRCATTMAHVGR